MDKFILDKVYKPLVKEFRKLLCKLAFPSMSTEKRLSISSPCVGRVIFDTDEESIFIWNGEEWIESGSGGGGGAASPTNGLEDISGDIGLGGSLIQQTVVDLDEYSFQILSTAQASGGFGLAPNAGEFGLYGPTGSTVVSLQFTTDGVTTSNTITDLGLNGLSYAANYATNNATNDRWIPDKGYVDGSILGKQLTGYTVGTNTALNSSDTILSAFGKLQQQSNNRLSINSVLTTFSVGADTTVANTDTVLQSFGKLQGQINAIKGGRAGGYEPFTADGTTDVIDIIHGLNIDNGNGADPNRYWPESFSLTNTLPDTTNLLDRSVSFPDADTMRITFTTPPTLGEDANYSWIVYK